MELRILNQIRTLKGKRVILRLDLNVPLKAGRVEKYGDWRLDRALPTIKYLIKQQAKIIIVAHLGRPHGKVDAKFSLKPVAKTLSKKLKKQIKFWSKDLTSYENDSYQLKNGTVVMLENFRFQAREKKNCQRLAKRLSMLGDIYVNDAFGNLHRQDASMDAITNYLPAYAGFLIQTEVDHLSEVLATKKGLAIIFGGAKAATKMKLIKKSSSQADNILVGGALANTILKASGYEVGKSLVDEESLKIAKQLIRSKVHIPLDVLVATGLNSKKYKIVSVSKVSKNVMMLDIGPATIKKYINILNQATLVVWNGPFGYFENKNFVQGSQKIMQVLAKSKAKVILGGGETVELAQKLKLDNQFYFISTGGGAMLTYLQGTKMPALEKLKK